MWISNPQPNHTGVILDKDFGKRLVSVLVAELLTTAEVAARLHCTAQTVRNYVERGDLTPHMRLPGTRGFLFNATDIDAFAAARDAEEASA